MTTDKLNNRPTPEILASASRAKHLNRLLPALVYVGLKATRPEEQMI